jgi:hypothetical protein
MDYTLAVYNDAHDELTFTTALKELVKAGYPEALLNLKFATKKAAFSFVV